MASKARKKTCGLDRFFSHGARTRSKVVHRSAVWEHYDETLAAWAASTGMRTLTIPPYCEQAYHMYYLLMPTFEMCTLFIAYLIERGILSVFHYLPLHLSYTGKKYGGRPGDCPVTEDLSDRLVRLPLYTTLASDDQARVIEEILAFPH